MKMQSSEKITIPSLEEIQQRFNDVPRFRDPKRDEYVWFHADGVARVFGFSEFNEDLMPTINQTDFGRSVINQFGVAQLAQRSPLPFRIRFKYWLYSKFSMTKNEPDFEEKENDGFLGIEYEHELTKRLQIMKNFQIDIEYERELTKRFEIEKNFRIEMSKLDLQCLEINHKYEKNNV